MNNKGGLIAYMFWILLGAAGGAYAMYMFMNL